MILDVDVFLFDFDGTLIAPSIDFNRMYRETFSIIRDFGVYDPVMEQLHILEIVERAEARLRPDHGMRREFLKQVHTAILDVELGAAERAEVYLGVPEMLEELADRGRGVAIVTRNSRAAVMRILERQALHYDVLLTRDDVAHVKPDPRHLLEALEHFSETKRCAAMCGDHPMDVLAGKRIGALTVGVLTPDTTEERFAEVKPDLVVSHPPEILEYID
ncbi:MAG: HAD family hydrolase [Anaerolineales bacterium]